jgi:hypothetical protein
MMFLPLSLLPPSYHCCYCYLNCCYRTIIDSIERIESAHGTTGEPAHIKEFVDNIDKEIYGKIETHLTNLRNQNTIKPMRVAVTDEMKERGISGETLEVPITFDPSNFFV